MKKHLFTFLIIVISTQTYAQIEPQNSHFNNSYKQDTRTKIFGVNNDEKVKIDLFNLALRPGLDLNIFDIYLPTADGQEIDLGNNKNFRVGIEAEFIIPYYKNRWSLIIEPTYQSFSAEKTYDVDQISGGVLIGKLDYSAIELPIGIRHTFFLNESSKIYLNAQYLINFDLNPTLKVYTADGTNLDNLKMNSEKNFVLGAGYKFRDKYIIEFRYHPTKFILDKYRERTADYKTMAVILGYNFM